MASQRTIDSKRGAEESVQQIATLREKWPLAFPAKSWGAKPLEISAAAKIAEAMGWSLAYTWGVLAPWKASTVYCHAVLYGDRRITLDGEAAEPVDAEAKELARERLAKKARKVEKRDASSPAVTKPQSAPESPKPAPQPESVPASPSGRLSLAGLKAAAQARRQAC